MKVKETPPVFTEGAGFNEAVGLDLIPSEDVIIFELAVGELPRVKPEL